MPIASLLLKYREVAPAPPVPGKAFPIAATRGTQETATAVRNGRGKRQGRGEGLFFSLFSSLSLKDKDVGQNLING